jgi:hypothetical protein
MSRIKYSFPFLFFFSPASSFASPMPYMADDMFVSVGNFSTTPLVTPFINTGDDLIILAKKSKEEKELEALQEAGAEAKTQYGPDEIGFLDEAVKDLDELKQGVLLGTVVFVGYSEDMYGYYITQEAYDEVLGQGDDTDRDDDHRMCGNGDNSNPHSCTSSDSKSGGYDQEPVEDTIDAGQKVYDSSFGDWYDGLDDGEISVSIPDELLALADTFASAIENRDFESLSTAQQMKLLESLDESISDLKEKREDLEDKLSDFKNVLDNAKNFYDLTTDLYADCTDKGYEDFTDCLEDELTEKKDVAAQEWEDLKSGEADVDGLGIADQLLSGVLRRCERSGPKDRPLIDNNLSTVSDIKRRIEEFNDKYAAEKGKLCDVADKLYTLVTLLEQLKNVREDGISLFAAYHKKTHHVSGITRTVQMSLDLRFYPDLQSTLDSGEVSATVSIDNDGSFFKWSDQDRKYLGSMLPIGDTDDSACKGKFWIPLSDALKVQIYLELEDVDEGEEVSYGDVSICLKAPAVDVEHDFGPYTINLPFGYMAAFSDMKDGAKQELVGLISDGLGEAFGIGDGIEGATDKLARN